MKKQKSTKFLWQIILAAFLTICLGTPVQARINIDTGMMPEGYVLVKKTDRNIAPGITETQLISNTQEGDMQQIDYLMEVDMSEDASTKIVASYGSDYDASSWELSTMEEQINGYENYMSENHIEGESVVAAVNADFFNMGTGEPAGALVMNGKIIKQPSDTYFCITKEGKADLRYASEPMDDVEQAVGGGPFLVKDGVPQKFDDPIRMTRAAIGLKKDGTIVTFVTHGISDKSAGHTLNELSSLMAAAGCENAINLDGGGSATYMAKYEGTDKMEVCNNPSDGKLRSVSSGLLFISTSEKNGIFDHSSISPNDEVYTPEQTIEFTATGVDAGGGEAPLPEGTTWTIEDESMGTIDADTGVVTVKDKEGTLVVHQMYEGKVVGTASVEIRHPDQISFKTDEVSLGFEASSTLGLEVRWQQRDVHLKDGDIEWQLSDPEMGHFEGNTFISSDGKTLEGTITGYSKYDHNVYGSIHAIIGKLPTVAWDFEDHIEVDEETGTETVIPAKEYWKIGKGNDADTPFIATTSNDADTGVDAEIVDIDTGEVRVGKNALKLSYDFTKSGDATRGAYFGTKEDYEIPGSPTAIGVWVYAPEGIDNFWLRGQVPYMQADGTWSNGSTTYVDFTYQPDQKLPDGSVVSKEDSGINWEGWKYLEADLTQKGSTQFKLAAGATFRIMYVPGIGMGSKTAGYIYLDNMQFVYGTNVDDTDSPVIDTMQFSTDNSKYQSFEDGMIIKNNKISFMSTFHDVENKYTKGIDYDLVRMYVDGVNVGVKGQDESGETIYADNFIIDDSKNTSYLYDMEFANGFHSIKTVVRDKGGNETEETVSFLVQGNNADQTTLTFEAASTGNPVLGKPYELIIRTNRIEDLADISASISIKNEFAKDYEIIWNEEFSEVENSYNANKGVLDIKGKRSTEASNSGEGIVATLRLKMPTDVKQGTKFEYNVLKGAATYNSEKSDNYAKSFSAQKASIEILAPLVVTTDTIFEGKTGKIYVTDVNNKKVEGASVYISGTDQLLGTTNSEGFVETDELGKNVSQYSIYAKKGEDISFIYTDFCYAVGGNSDGLPQHIMSHVTEDNTTEKSLTWFTDPFASKDMAIMQIAKKEDYDVNGENAFSNVQGTTQMITLNGSADSTDNHAFRLNSVIATGLTPGASYMYRVGDGEKYSELKSFTMPYDNKDVNFFVLGDIQTLDMERTNKIANILMSNGISYDFGLQTGDAVDNGAKYEYWDGIANLYGELLDSMNMIHVFGNHEYEGDLSGNNSKAIYNIPTENNGDYYSFKYGNVYFAVINYTKDAAKLQQAADWLVEDANASDATWKVVAVHQPPYFTNPTGGNDLIHEILPPACDKANIDFVFSGHDHTYTRTKPLVDGKVDESGTVYMISGTTGDKTYPTIDSGFEFDKYITSFDGVYMSVSATSNSFTIEAYEANGNVLDSYTKTKTFECDENGHEYVLKDGFVSCIHCKQTIELAQFTGVVKNADNGRYMGFMGGQMQIGWTQFDTEVYYFNKDGFAEEVSIVERDEPSCMVREYTRYHCDVAEEDYEVWGTRAPLHIYEDQPDGSRICKVCGWKQVHISQLTIEQDYDAYYYSGSPRRVNLEVSYTDENGKKTIFKQGSEFLISCRDNLLPGTATYEFIPIEVNIGDAVDRHCGSITGGRFTRTYEIRVREPKTITGTDITDNSVTLSWDKLPYITGYELYQYNTDTKNFELINTLEGNDQNTCILNNLKADEQYKFKVRSYVTVDGNTYYSDFSKEKTLKTKTIEVAVPQNLTAKNITQKTITLNWDNVEGAAGYEVYKYSTQAKKYVLVDTVTENTYTAENLTADTTYRFKVRAYVQRDDKTFYSAYCNPEEYTTEAPPKFVAAPTLEPIKASKGVLTLTWNKVEDATAYNIYHYNRQTLKYEYIGWTKDTTIQLMDQPKGEIDTYRVKAYFKGSGETISSVYSNAQSAKLFDSTTLSEVQQSGENLKFTWSKVKGTNGYSIYRKVVGEAEWQYLGATAGTSYTDENCQTGVRYAYRILPYGKVNGTAFFGPYSAPVYGMVLAKEIEAPTLEPITASQGILTLTWNKVENATAYNIYHYNRQTLKYELIAWTKDTTIQLSDQPKGEIDTYRVKAYCKGNGKTISSKYSNSQSAKLFESITLSNVEQSESGLTFTWSGVAGANGYTVYRRVVGEAEWTRLDATAELTYVDEEALNTPGVRYAYRILPYGKVNGTAYFGPYSKAMEGMVFEKLEITEIVSNEGKVELSWNEIPGVIGYNVYRYNGENDTWETQKSVLDGTTYVDEAVEAGNTYSYYVKPYYRTSLNNVKYGYQSEVQEVYVE